MNLPKKKHRKDTSMNGITHGLWGQKRKDRRRREFKAYKSVVGCLLAPFPTPAPAMVQLLAGRCAFKLLRAASYECFVLGGGKSRGEGADNYYLSLTSSIRNDLQALHQLAKDGPPVEKVPSLQEYLQGLKQGQVLPVSPGPDAASGPGEEDSHE